MSYRPKHFNGGFPPPLFIIHHAVKLAVKKVGSSFNNVMKFSQRQRGHVTHEQRMANRARIYAALALRALFIERCDDEAIARQLFVNSPETWFYQIDHKIREGAMNSWWSDEIFMHVLEETEKMIEAAKNPTQQAAE